jgi:short subunit dehydrogenase-like uncharacterized protein
MFVRHTLTTAVALVLLTGADGWRQLIAAQNSANGSETAARATLAPVYDAHERLAARFQNLRNSATGSEATAKERQDFVRFLKGQVLLQLDREGVVLYPVFDSLTNGGYATPAALFDGGGISRLVKELENPIASGDRVEFKATSYALAIALESYFTKTEFLVLPVVHQLLNEVGIRALLARLESVRAAS